MSRPLEITCPLGHGTYDADEVDETCPACSDDEPSYFANFGFRALIAVRAFAASTGLDPAADQDGLETCICDLLASLNHLADSAGLSYEDMGTKAWVVHREEVAEGRALCQMQPATMAEIEAAASRD